MAVLNSLFLIYFENCRQERVVLSEYKCVVKILEHVPGCLLDFVARKYHIDTRIDAVLDLDGKDSGVTVKILGFTLEAIETVCVLQIESCNASHIPNVFV